MSYTDRREPGVYVTIEDKSYVEQTVESGRSVYSVILCDRGPSDQIVHVTSQKQFHNVFGTPNYLKTSQTMYQIDASLLYTSNALVTRVVPDDAALANIAIKEGAKDGVTADMTVHGKFVFTIGSNIVTVTPDPSSQASVSDLTSLAVGDWIFFADYDSATVTDKGLSKAAQIINKVVTNTTEGDTTINSTSSIKLTLDRKYDGDNVDTTTTTTLAGNAYKYVPYSTSSMADVTDASMLTNTSGDVLYYFYANGAGKYYNSLAIRGTRNTDLEKINIDADGNPLYKYMFSATRSVVK